ncbi:PTS system mannose/fructose/sorbose family transporter subunit IID [Anaerovibrio sp.]|uniref:PTS system mannose/fructose/sorbose family transporter subunit IID n=1 Tax=Anaerovibrio sp. TaxID=1872532 RepID=UPI003F13FC30
MAESDVNVAASAEYEDKAVRAVVTPGDLVTMVWRSLFLQASFNYERMQACGWLYGILPVLKKIHTNKRDLSSSMLMHMEFFNTHPFLVNFIMGLVVAMEESKKDQNTIRAIKVATMGPLGGIGDALCWLTLLPITAGLGASMAMGADPNPAGPIVFLVLFNIIHFSLRFGLMRYGYHTGVRAIATMKEKTKQISHGASIIGLTVVGGLIASMIKLKLAWVIVVGQASIALQEKVFDAIMPNMLPLAYTLFMYYLLKKNYSPVKLILFTIVIGVAGKGIGIF